MTISKWIMKQYWRVGTIRALLSLALGMLVLGKLYYIYIPVVGEWGLFGALTLGSVLVLLFMVVGWLYDEKAELWNESVVIQTERYPYAFVPEYRTYAIEYPAMYALIRTLRDSLQSLDCNPEILEDLSAYLDDFFRKRPQSRDDIFSSEEQAEEFLSRYPILGEHEDTRGEGYTLLTRMKRAFQLWLLRLNYIQSLTGLGQDVLVFAAFYVAIIFPAVADGTLVPVEYLLQGIIFLSIPIFVLMVLAGWFYDRKLKLWSPDLAVQVERNPYSYLPEPRTYSLTVPMLYALLGTLQSIMTNQGLDTGQIEKTCEFLNEFLKLSVSKEEDMQIALDLRARLGDPFRALDSVRSDD